MTGDDKVVAWRFDSPGMMSVLTADESYLLAAQCADVTITPLIPQSAYAELAAELAALKEIAIEQDAAIHSGTDALLQTDRKLKAAESQLAELRGKCAGLADAWRDEAAETWGESKEHATLQRCSDELRAAAGDSP